MKIQGQLNTANQVTSADFQTQNLKSFNAQKKEFQRTWQIIYLAVSIASALLLKKIYMFQTMPEFDNVREGTFMDLITIALPFGLVFTIFDLFVHYMLDDFYLKYCLTQERYEGPARAKRAYTLVKWSYSIFYYLITSVVAYMLLKETIFFPTWLGGKGSCSNVFLGAPNIADATYTMKIFYLFQFGKHFSRLFSHMFIRPQGNYYQYILHHSLSNFLIFFSYLTNMWLIGIMVLLCHDFSDLFLILARTYKDVKFCYKPLLKIFYLLGFFAWIGCRIIIYPICCVYPALATVHTVAKQYLDEVGLMVMQIPYYAMGLMLAILLVLQIFWTYYIVQSFLSVNVTAKVTHNYD